MISIPLEHSEIQVLFLCGRTREDAFNDFKEWSGGFEPNESDQIYTYIETAMPQSLFDAIEYVYDRNNKV